MRSLRGHRHRPSGTGLSSGTIPASPMAAPATRAPDHLAPQHARGAQTFARDFYEPGVPTSCLTFWSAELQHSGPCPECCKLAASSIREAAGTWHASQSITSCASVTPTARQPHKVMPGERVGRARGEPDGGRDRHDGPAAWCAGVATVGPLRAREHRLSFSVTATVATSRYRSRLCRFCKACYTATVGQATGICTL